MDSLCCTCLTTRVRRDGINSSSSSSSTYGIIPEDSSSSSSFRFHQQSAARSAQMVDDLLLMDMAAPQAQSMTERYQGSPRPSPSFSGEAATTAASASIYKPLLAFLNISHQGSHRGDICSRDGDGDDINGGYYNGNKLARAHLTALQLSQNRQKKLAGQQQ
jgi:hypothetical protein